MLVEKGERICGTNFSTYRLSSGRCAGRAFRSMELVNVSLKTRRLKVSSVITALSVTKQRNLRAALALPAVNLRMTLVQTAKFRSVLFANLRQDKCRRTTPNAPANRTTSQALMQLTGALDQSCNRSSEAGSHSLAASHESNRVSQCHP